MDTPLVFVVVEDNEIIAEDICEAIKEYVGAALVLNWKKAETDLDAFRNLPELCAVFAALQDKDIVAMGLDDALRRKGVALIVCGSRDVSMSDQTATWHRLERPFTTYDVHALLRNLGIAKASNPV